MRQNVPLVQIILFFILWVGNTKVTAQCQGFSVSVNEPPLYTYCNGDSITFTATPTGGTPPYSYVWSSGGTAQTETVSAYNGLFIVTVTDANGCVADNAAHLKPVEAYVNAYVAYPGCLGQVPASITAFINNADVFEWSTGETTQSILVSSPGPYTVTVTNLSVGCTATDTVTATFLTPDIPIINGPATLCEGQNATLSFSGGNFINQLWMPGGQTTPTITVSSPGIYSVTAMNNSGCTGSDTIEILPVPIDPPILNGDPLICPGSEQLIDISNSSTYTSFQWSTGANTPGITINGPGNYTVTVTDAGGCTASGNIVVTAAPNAPLPVATSTDATCGDNNGSIDLSVSPPGSYTYNWSNGATTEDLNNIPPGTYDVTISSATGCSATLTELVNDVPINISILEIITPNTSCISGNGEIDLTVSPSNNYNYFWSNGATTEDVQNLDPGAYSVTVSLGSTCTASGVYLVGNNAPTITATVTPTSNTSCAAPNGSIDLSVSPAGAYSFLWSNGQPRRTSTGSSPAITLSPSPVAMDVQLRSPPVWMIMQVDLPFRFPPPQLLVSSLTARST